MSTSRLLTRLSIWAGLWFAAFIWAVNMQLGQILPYTDCGSQLHWSAITSFFGAALAMAAGLVSWLAARNATRDSDAAQGNTDLGRTVGALSASIFTFALLMQGVAAIVLTGCEK
ncbi:hypothetical protein FBZ96_10254 [Bradyrhizobium stylosanthis]|uniref:Uncharacterized protein n=3 Tax=Bradyrhizobium stylosanthis TaxID=1803665 RepID=A0A560E2T7_9BRAD|nr:hypothetical protein FBZ96_10254 [Bradyrhizobium stylosanthis]